MGHLKTDHRLEHNFYKDIFGDVVNVLLAAVAYNFKRAMRVLLNLIEKNQRDVVNKQYLVEI